MSFGRLIKNFRRKARASLAARTQTFLLKRYWLTAGFREIRKFKNKHRGEHCFIIGNGPSLAAEDLSQLKKSNLVCFGFNRIYKIFDQTDWRPTYYMSQDEKMLRGSVEEVNEMNLRYKFIPIQDKYYHDINIEEAIHYKMIYQNLNVPLRLFSRNSALGIFAGGTVVYSAMQLAMYMGFTKIYLLGVDHNFSKSMNNKGEVVIDSNAKDYFCEDYNADSDDLYVPNTENTTKTYCDAKHHLDQMGIEVFNATRGGKLEEFPRVNFDTIFSK